MCIGVKSFSRQKNSCYTNHDRYTLCPTHYHHEGHTGGWQDCKKCKKDIELPNYNYFGTNKYHFEVLENIETGIISCVNCGFTTDLMEDFASQAAKGYYRCKKKYKSAAAEII